MDCPKCDGELVVDSYEGVEIDRCHKCSGVWLDLGELATIIKKEDEKFSKELVQRVMKEAFTGIPDEEIASEKLCPKCSQNMIPVNYSYSSGVVIDRCPEHGIWLDKGELEKVQASHEEWEKMAKKEHENWQKQLDSIEVDPSLSDPTHGPSSFGFINRVINFLIKNDL